jgi:hypothetical protein
MKQIESQLLKSSIDKYSKTQLNEKLPKQLLLQHLCMQLTT